MRRRIRRKTINKMSTQKRKFELFARLQSLGFTYEEAVSLRRAEMTLQRWGEELCNGTIQRDEKTEKPFRIYGNYIQANDPRSVHFIADREAGALRRVMAICGARNARIKEHDCVLPYHQTDPRGCALYLVKRSDLTSQENQIITKARSNGAKIEFRYIDSRAPSGCYVCLDMNGTDLWRATFNTEEAAAEAYLRHRKLAVPARDVLPIDRYYSRGLAICS
jgi:hypothetical protein